MKKLFYIILVVAVLALVGKFVKEKQAETPVVENVTLSEEEVAISPDTVVTDDLEAEIQPIADDGSNPSAAVIDEVGDNGDGMVLDSTTQSGGDVVEENPEFTADDDETIVAE
ncbi:MAG: hypothetical protein ACK5N8_02770 [Alphaproteobacteria bacterium]